MTKGQPASAPLYSNRVNAWLEDALVASRRAELWIDLLHTFEGLPRDQQRTFVSQLPDDVKYYITRDASYMNVVRLGEQIQKTIMPKLQLMVHARGMPSSRDDIKNPIGMLRDFCNRFNHPEKALMPEPPVELLDRLLRGARDDLTLLYPEIDFHNGSTSQAANTPQPSEDTSPWDMEHTSQMLWHPGINIGDGVDYSSSLVHQPQKRRHLEGMSQVTARVRVFYPTEIGQENFVSLVHQALHFRTMRLGSLIRAIDVETGHQELLSDRVTRKVKDHRRQIAHFYDTINFRPDILIEEDRAGKRFSVQVEEAMRACGAPIHEERFAAIPVDNQTFIQSVLEKIAPPEHPPLAKEVDSKGASVEGTVDAPPVARTRGDGTPS